MDIRNPVMAVNCEYLNGMRGDSVDFDFLFNISGDEGLELYLETKTITIKLPANTN